MKSITIENHRSRIDSLRDHLFWQLNLLPCSERDYGIALAIIDDVLPSGLLSSSIEGLFESLSEQLDDLDFDEVMAVLKQVQQFDPRVLQPKVCLTAC